MNWTSDPPNSSVAMYRIVVLVLTLVGTAMHLRAELARDRIETKVDQLPQIVATVLPNGPP